jgi:hypothetical protein
MVVALWAHLLAVADIVTGQHVMTSVTISCPVSLVKTTSGLSLFFFLVILNLLDDFFLNFFLSRGARWGYLGRTFVQNTSILVIVPITRHSRIVAPRVLEVKVRLTARLESRRGLGGRAD